MTQAHGNARITAEQAKEISVSPLTGGQLAQKYGISPVAVHFIRTGRNWNRATGLPKRPKGKIVIDPAA